ncbi:MAG TPA: hypothetical protein VGO08_02565, partial [Burkholderiales bacterium]|nr:hypothetical protein [Burkholderiales bacterium]
MSAQAAKAQLPAAGIHQRSSLEGVLARGIDWRAIDALGVSRLVSDSRQVVAGDTFVAYPG